jgi:hypothetical protein
VVTPVSLVSLLAFVALVPLAILSVWAHGQLAQVVDYASITGAASHWLATGQFYQPWQIAGPYAIQLGSAVDILHPPVVLWLAVPFVFLPPILWWVIPMAAAMWAVVRMRAAAWTWPVLFMLWALAREVWLVGNVGMWIVAAEALGLLYRWPAVLVLVKPSLAPFALVGVRRRAWWLGLGVLLLLCVPFGALWLDWWRAAIVNPTNGGPLYSFAHVPAMLIPIVAWAGSTRESAAIDRLWTGRGREESTGRRQPGRGWRTRTQRALLRGGRRSRGSLTGGYWHPRAAVSVGIPIVIANDASAIAGGAATVTI